MPHESHDLLRATLPNYFRNEQRKCQREGMVTIHLIFGYITKLIALELAFVMLD